jgi:hypothetical protein
VSFSISQSKVTFQRFSPSPLKNGCRSIAASISPKFLNCGRINRSFSLLLRSGVKSITFANTGFLTQNAFQKFTASPAKRLNFPSFSPSFSGLSFPPKHHPKVKNYLNKKYIQAEKSKFICFFEGSGKALDEEVLSSMFIKLKKKINAEHKRKILSDNFSFYSIRYKFITTLINSGQPIEKISTIVSRASIAMTD